MKKLRIAWSKREKDFLVQFPCRADGSFISELIRPWKIIHPTALCGTHWTNYGYKISDDYSGALGSYSLMEMDWVKELDRRGYDITTLKFEIKQKTHPEPGKLQDGKEG